MYRLVVIDDEYIVVQGIKALISRLKLDYEVVGAAYDGIQGLEVIRSEKPDVVITDIRIPGLDGLSVIEAAKEECPDTYFIVICPLSSRQVRYLKVSDKNTYISFWSVGIFMHTISLYIF